MKLGAHKWIRQGRVRESAGAEPPGLCSSGWGGMGQVKRVPSSRAGAGVVKGSSYHPQVCCISQKLSDTAASGNVSKAQCKTTPALTISKKLFPSLRCCTTQMILHTLTNVHFYSRGSLTLPKGTVVHISQSSCTEHLNLQQLL